METTVIILNFSVLFACISTGFAIKCFQCNSAKDVGCESLSVNDTQSPYYLECEEKHKGYTSFCRKSVYKILNEPDFYRVNRECGWLIYKTNTTRCYDIDSDFSIEVECQCFKDGCNKAPQVSSTILITCFALVVAFGISLLKDY